MTEVVTEDGSKMETNLPADKVADLQAKPAAEPAKPEAQPASQTEDEPEPAKPEAKPEAPKADAEPEPAKREKPKPIAKLLEERHSLREENARLKAELEKAVQQPASPQKAEDVKALAEKYGVDADLLTELADTIRKGITPSTEVPKELQELLAERQATKAEEAEKAAFEDDFGRLAKSIPDPEIKDPKAKEKLLELAYSDKLAPDGEPYFKKSLVELYYYFVKPEIEPGKPSAEPSRGGSKSGGKVVDFAQINADPAAMSEFVKTASKEQFAKFHQWQLENEKEPLKKPGF